MRFWIRGWAGLGELHVSPIVGAAASLGRSCAGSCGACACEAVKTPFGPTKSPVVPWLTITVQLLDRRNDFLRWEHRVLSKSCELKCGVMAISTRIQSNAKDASTKTCQSRWVWDLRCIPDGSRTTWCVGLALGRCTEKLALAAFGCSAQGTRAERPESVSTALVCWKTHPVLSLTSDQGFFARRQRFPLL